MIHFWSFADLKLLTWLSSTLVRRGIGNHLFGVSVCKLVLFNIMATPALIAGTRKSWPEGGCLALSPKSFKCFYGWNTSWNIC